MSDARVHTQSSNRAQKKKRKERASEHDEGRKVVFKSVLDNPLVVKWPNVPMNVQNTVLAALTRVLDESGIAQFHEEREKRSRHKKVAKSKLSKKAAAAAVPPQNAAPLTALSLKRKAVEEQDTSTPVKKRRLESATLPPAPTNAVQDASNIIIDNVPAIVGDPKPLTPPAALSNIVFGINEISKRLEAQIAFYRQRPRGDTMTDLPPTRPSLRFVFACTQDIDPPALLEHFPLLIATCNASRGRSNSDKDVILIPLPKNAEGALTEAVKLRRTAVIALDSDTPGISALEQFASSFPVLSAPWLIPPIPPTNSTISSRLIATQVKQLRTTAPTDIRAAKEQRTQERAQAKARAIAKRGGK